MGSWIGVDTYVSFPFSSFPPIFRLNIHNSSRLTHLWPGSDLQVFPNARLGDIRLRFKSKKSANNYPFPGDLIIYNAHIQDSAWKDGVAINNCINWSNKGELIGTDCSGNKISLNACDEGFEDEKHRVVNTRNLEAYGWRYVMAFLVQGAKPGC
jgi:hypothetical protein